MAVKWEAFETGDDAQHDFRSFDQTAQTFLATADHNLTMVSLLIGRNGFPGNMTVEIQGTVLAGGVLVPDGAAIATSDVIDVNAWGAGPIWHDIPMLAPVALTAGVTYAIVCIPADGAFANEVRWRYNSAGGYPGGMICWNFAFVGWLPVWTEPAHDYMFAVWGDPAVPTVATQTPSGISAYEATLEGVLTYDGHETCSCYFEYGDTPALGTATTPVAGFVTGDTFSETIGGLVPGTNYYYRAVATNSSGTSYGVVRSFGVPFAPPSPPGTFTEELIEVPSLYGAMIDDPIIVALLEGK